MTDLHDILLTLERQVYDPAVRHSPAKSGQLFADDFVEFGSNGNVYNKAGILEALEHGRVPAGKLTIAGFEARELGESVALVTYRLEVLTPEGALERLSLRSTIYRRIDGVWKQVFHQATPM
jgi:hypothetical protein